MDRFKSTKMVSIFSGLGNIILFIIKGIIAFYSNSLAMMADTINSLGDILSSIMTFIGNKISSEKADYDHHLGHGKAEYIYSLLISVVMIIMSLKVIKSSILSFWNINNYDFSIYLIVVCLVTIFVKFGLYIYSSKMYKRYNNILVKSVSIDHRNDCILTLFNLISVICSYYNIYFIDGIVGIIISCWIIYSAIRLFIQSYDVLMDKAMDNMTVERVLKIINTYPDIKKVTHFNTTPVGYQYQISFTIFVDGNMSTFDSHEIANKLEKEITSKIDEIYLTIIHVNPL